MARPCSAASTFTVIAAPAPGLAPPARAGRPGDASRAVATPAAPATATIFTRTATGPYSLGWGFTTSRVPWATQANRPSLLTSTRTTAVRLVMASTVDSATRAPALTGAM